MMAMLNSDMSNALDMKQTIVMAKPPRQGIMARCLQP